MRNFKWKDILLGVLFTLFFISIGTIVIINFRGLYYQDITVLNIEETSGIPKDQIIENYDALIDYCSPFFTGPLEFPSLPASESGLIHFEEVKDIFILFYKLAVLTFVILLPLLIYKTKKKEYHYLLISSITMIALPTVVGLACMINFNQTFILFHKLFFQNDYWLFDPDTDPIIRILPEAFFLHCAIGIITIVLLGSLLLLCLYFYKKHRSLKRNPIEFPN